MIKKKTTLIKPRSRSSTLNIVNKNIINNFSFATTDLFKYKAHKEDM